MPNTVVKLTNAESTWLEAAWEDRKLLINVERGCDKIHPNKKGSAPDHLVRGRAFRVIIFYNEK